MFPKYPSFSPLFPEEMLLIRWFNATSMTLIRRPVRLRKKASLAAGLTCPDILHPPSWHREYGRHWQNPEETNPAILGQLFAICGLAMQSYHKNQDEPYEYRGRAVSLSANYRSLTQQCLLLVDFTKPEQTALETMVLHLHGEYTKAGEVDIGLWVCFSVQCPRSTADLFQVLVGMITRLAMRMGLHRDSKVCNGTCITDTELTLL